MFQTSWLYFVITVGWILALKYIGSRREIQENRLDFVDFLEPQTLHLNELLYCEYMAAL